MKRSIMLVPVAQNAFLLNEQLQQQLQSVLMMKLSLTACVRRLVKAYLILHSAVHLETAVGQDVRNVLMEWCKTKMVVVSMRVCVSAMTRRTIYRDLKTSYGKHKTLAVL
jgi:hypothetical protein